MAAFVIAVAGYTYYEADKYFIDEKVFENRIAECSSCGKKCKSDYICPLFD